jgi:hypothetical protein
MFYKVIAIVAGYVFFKIENYNFRTLHLWENYVTPSA